MKCWKFIFLAAFVTLVFAGCHPKARPSSDVEKSEMETRMREAELVARSLAEEMNGAREIVEKLRAEKKALAIELAACKVGRDREKTVDERTSWPESGPSVSDGVTLGEILVVLVDADLKFVAFDAGTAQGIKPGTVFQVMRGERKVASIKATDVRDGYTGAVVEEAGADGFPMKGDRIVIGRSQTR